MSETKWTKGPWRFIEEYSSEWAAEGNIVADDECVLDASTSGNILFPSRADAYLIAAAPDMYAELSSIADWFLSCGLEGLSEQHGYVMQRYKRIADVLAKARGEG